MYGEDYFKNTYPFCINKCIQFILQIHKDRTTKILSDILVTNCAGEMKCMDLVGKCWGNEMYGFVRKK